MKQGENVTKVVFRKWQGTIIALFPEDPATPDGVYCSSYEHASGHGAAYYKGIVARSRPATLKEYADLKRELESAPYHYKLVVCKRWIRGKSN